jgi:Peptidase A4 family
LRNTAELSQFSSRLLGGGDVMSKSDTIHESSVEGVFVYSPPPPEFLPLEASNDELIRFGFPPRPCDTTSSTFKVWKRFVSKETSFVVPTVEETDIHHGPITRLPVLKGATMAFTSDDFNNGIIIDDPTKPFSAPSTVIHAAFNVPLAICTSVFGKVLPGGAVRNVSYWVGFDGFNSSQDRVLQCGVDSYVTSIHTGSIHNFWIEWYPNPSVKVFDPPIHNGNDVDLMITVLSSTEAMCHLTNNTNKQKASLKLVARPGITLIGNSAVWDIERPIIAGARRPLANYGGTMMRDCAANGKVETTPSTAQTGATIWNLAMDYDNRLWSTCSVAAKSDRITFKFEQ